MKALVYTELRKLEIRDWPDPELAEGEALVRIGGAGVCGSDVHGWMGHSRGRIPPLVLGHEMAGEVLDVRGGDGRIRRGAIVAVYPLIGCNQCAYCASGREALCRRRKLMGMHVAGGFAEYLRAPLDNLYPISAPAAPVRGALVEPLANAIHFVRAAEHDRGPLAVLGAGAIGLLMLEVVGRMGFDKAAVVEPNPYRAQIARTLGAALTVNPNDPDALERLESFFGEDGCTAVLDAAGFAPTRQMALKLVRSGGLVVLAGLGEADTTLDFVEVTRREIRLAGVYGYSRQDFETAVEWFGQGRLDATWASEASLYEGQAIFEDLVRPETQLVKVILKP